MPPGGRSSCVPPPHASPLCSKLASPHPGLPAVLCYPHSTEEETEAREWQGPARTSQEASQDRDPDPADSGAFSSLPRTLPVGERGQASKDPLSPERGLEGFQARGATGTEEGKPQVRGRQALQPWPPVHGLRLSGSWPPPTGHPLSGVPFHPSRCRLCGPGRMPLFISRVPLPFDSSLPSVSADLCVLGIQLEARTERVTAALNPASAPPSTPGGACGLRGACLSCQAQRGALWGLAAWGGVGPLRRWDQK